MSFYNWTEVAECVSDMQRALSYMNDQLLVSAINRSVLTGRIKYQLFSYHDGSVSVIHLPELYGNRHDIVDHDNVSYFYIFLYIFGVCSFFFNMFFCFVRCRSRGYQPLSGRDAH